MDTGNFQVVDVVGFGLGFIRRINGVARDGKDSREKDSGSGYISREGFPDPTERLGRMRWGVSVPNK